jgi:hypothetical protein
MRSRKLMQQGPAHRLDGIGGMVELAVKLIETEQFGLVPVSGRSRRPKAEAGLKLAFSSKNAAAVSSAS